VGGAAALRPPNSKNRKNQESGGPESQMTLQKVVNVNGQLPTVQQQQQQQQ